MTSLRNILYFTISLLDVLFPFVYRSHFSWYSNKEWLRFLIWILSKYLISTTGLLVAQKKDLKFIVFNTLIIINVVVIVIIMILSPLNLLKSVADTTAKLAISKEYCDVSGFLQTQHMQKTTDDKCHLLLMWVLDSHSKSIL